MEGVFIDNFLGNNVKLMFHIFGIWEVIIQVESFYVSDEAFSSRCRNDAVEQAFRGGNGCRWGT